MIATAGPTRAAALEEIGAQVIAYGDGMAERVSELTPGPWTAPWMPRRPGAGSTAPAGPVRPGGSLPTLSELTGDPDRVLTFSGFAAAAEPGVHITTEIRHDQMNEFARLAGEGILVVPVARTYALDQIQKAAELSQSRRPGGKLLLVL
ncbi:MULTISPECIES: zinc-binding dehydrogenase [Streptomyces]